MAKENVKTKPQDFDSMLEQKPDTQGKPEAPIVKPAIAKSTKRLSGTRIQLTGYLRNSWDITAERGTQVSDLITPEYWAHVAANLRPHDTLNVIAEDGTFYARLLVINADRLWAKVHVLEQADLTASYKDMPASQEEEYEVIWNPIGKYTVLKKDQRGLPPIKDGFQTKLEAWQWVDGHIKTLNG